MKKYLFVVIPILITIIIPSCGSMLSDAYDGTYGWWLVGNEHFSDGEVSYISLAFNGDAPYVAYRDGANSSKATVMKLNRDFWEVVGLKAFSGGEASYVSLVISNGTPYVAYVDGSSSSSARVMKFDGSSWASIQNYGSSTSCVSLTEYEGTLYLAYLNSTSQIIVYSYDGSTWTQIGNNVSSGTAGYLKICSYHNTPYIGFSDYSYSSMASVMKYSGSGTTWNAVGSRGFSSSRVSNVALVVENDIPCIAFALDGNRYARVMTYNRSSWSVVGNSSPFNTWMHTDPSMGVYNGILYVVTALEDQRNGAARWNGSEWESVGQFNIRAGEFSIVIHNGVPHVAFPHDDSGMATVLRYGNSK